MREFALPPLAELHRHLDGSLRRTTLDELAAAHDLSIPDDFGFYPGIGVESGLALFHTTVSVLQQPDAVRRVADEMCQDAASEGITTFEIRFAPQLHRGGSIEDIVDAALDGIDGRAGLILCGLYVDPPDLVLDLVELAARRPGVVGIDLAGGPLPEQPFTMADYAPAFTRARELGLGRTVHAGEIGPPSVIADAIELLHAQRIGHGTPLLDDPRVTDLVLERGVVIEACPTSNVHCGVIPDVSAHPIAAWLARGVKVCVCTDNPLLSHIDLPGEYRRVADQIGVDQAGIEACIATGHLAAFAR
jgi:adenosine deaminase